MTKKLLVAGLLTPLLLMGTMRLSPAQENPAAVVTTVAARTADEAKADVKPSAEKPLSRTPERFLAIAEKLKATGKYEPKNGSTYCNYFARDFVKELLGRPLPELNGQANEQLTKLAASSDWEKGILVYQTNSAGKNNLKGMTAKELQDQQDKGNLILYCWKHPEWSMEMPREQRQKLHGHIAVGMPLKPGDLLATDEVWGTKENPVAVPMTAQSGSRVFAYGKLSRGFGVTRKNDILVFIYNPKAASQRIVRIGAVAYAPSAVTVFENMRRYFAKTDLPVDYVLYSNYDALVNALRNGQVDLAWNTPLAHAQYHLLCNGQSQTLVMRDVDCNFRCKLLVRKESGIKALTGLQGKAVALGSRESAEATVLPLHYLQKEGVQLDKVQFLRLDEELDLRGNPCSSPIHVLKALRGGRADAGIVGERLWDDLVARKAPEVEGLQAVWTSPPFSHCVFTAAHDFDKTLADRFTQLMLAMDSKDECTAEILRLESAKKWVAGSPDGFETLIEALRAEKLKRTGGTKD